MNDDELNALRKQLLANGYFPIPSASKQCRWPGWNSKEFYSREFKRYKGSTSAIDSWTVRKPDFRTTGTRLQDGLGAIDNDVDDKELSDALWDIIGEIAPAVADEAPVRFGGGSHKTAMFVRIEGETFVRIGSHSYARPSDLAAWRAEVAAAAEEAAGTDAAPRHVPKPAYHQVEIFGGAPTAHGDCSRQFGAFGWHTPPGATPGVMYRWMDKSLADVPLRALPTLTKAQAYAITKAFEEKAVKLGWEAASEVDAGDGAGSDIFDIDRKKSKFDVRGHGRISYQELEALVQEGEHVVCTAGFIPGEVSDTPDRCKAVWSGRYSCAVVKDWKTNARHYPNDIKSDSSMRELAALMEKIKHKQEDIGPGDADGGDEPSEPRYEDEQFAKVSWLIETRGYFEGEHKVVQLYSTRLDCRTTVQAFQQRFKAWFEPAKGKGGRDVYATEIWEKLPQRINLAGVRMRPDRPFPTFVESRAVFKNTYRRPQHIAEGGDIAPFLKFMKRFIPDPVEREWLLSWMAHKQRRPEIPGTSVWFVADTEGDTRIGQFGTGRGLLFSAVYKLYGEDYTLAQSFDIINGTSSQAVYTDWMHGAVLVTIDESNASATGYRRGERNAVYEALKEKIDPAPKRHTFKVKGGQSFSGMSYCSFWVATNHADAAAIPANDRRVTVLRNGAVITPAEVAEFLAWRDDDANIAALSYFLAERDLAGFDMFQPLATAGKEEMAELSISQVEHALVDIMEDENRGKAFPRSFILARMERAMGLRAGPWHGEFDGLWSRYCVKVDPVPGSTDKYRRLRIGGKPEKIFCFRRDLGTLRAMPAARLPIEINLWKEGVSQKEPFTGHEGGGGSRDKDE